MHETFLADIVEVTLSLVRSLRSKCRLRLPNFSDLVQSSLSIDIVSVIEGTVVDRKLWFIIARRAREILGDTRTEDEFSDDKRKLRA